MAKKNSYEKKAHQKQMLSGLGHTAAGEKKESLVAATITDIVVGGLLGATAGAIVGRGSFFAGMAVSGAGHYFGSRATAAFGVGMMATGGYQLAGMNGTSVSGIDAVKERLLAFKDDLKHKLFLDMIIKSKKTAQDGSNDETTNGLGEVQYFNYPNKELEGTPLNFNALEHIEKQIAASAEKHAAKQGISGTRDEDMEGIQDYNF